MKGKNYFILFFFCLLVSGFNNYKAQEINIPSFALSDVNFNVKIINLPDSLKSINVALSNNNHYSLSVNNGIVDTMLSVAAVGLTTIKVKGYEKLNCTIRIIPGWFSIVPPLLAIILALVLRQVLVSLSLGIFVGAIFIYDYNPFTALLRFADTIILNSVIDKSHALILLFTFLMGGVVGIISKNGGMVGLANVITKFAKTARNGMISTWLIGVIIFFDDYSNTLIVGNMMRPITDKLKISSEKLAYIVDSTSAPVASLFIISTWIGFELGLISDGLKVINSSLTAYDVFLQTIPYRFYPIATIIFVFLIGYMGRDFGPMLKAEINARKGGKLSSIDDAEMDKSLSDRYLYTGNKARWWNAAIPILIILFGTIAGLVFTGIDALKAQGSNDFSLRMIISNSDSYVSLLWASLIAGIVAIIMSISQKILNLQSSFNAWTKGIESMLFANLILVFAWAISSVTTDLKTADYILSVISNSLDPRLLPVIVFLICALTSFSTGTSWGTMAIVMPIVIPLGHKLSVTAGLNSADANIVLYGVVSSVLAGSVFGDHCSPIADTTILSSLASGCNHVDHVRTQLPYAVLIAIVCMVLGDIPTGYGLHPLISIIGISIILFVILRLKGKIVI